MARALPIIGEFLARGFCEGTVIQYSRESQTAAGSQMEFQYSAKAGATDRAPVRLLPRGSGIIAEQAMIKTIRIPDSVFAFPVIACNLIVLLNNVLIYVL
jgi:hypothetical protein